MQGKKCIGGRYTVEKVIGRGGTSLVYLAIDETLQCKRAIKEVSKEFRQDPFLWKREWNMVKQLHHPALVPVYDVLEEGKYVYFVMEYIKGKTVKELLEQGKQFSKEESITLGIKLCEVFQYLHTRIPPVIYRDLKPSNLMLQEDGKLILIDLGTAREYKSEQSDDTICWGTPGYAAPEQLQGQMQSSILSDIYTFGIVLYEIASGKRYDRESVEHPKDGLGMIIEQCTRMQPEARYSSFAIIQKELECEVYRGEKHQKKWKKRQRTCIFFGFLAILFFYGSYFLKQQEGILLEKGYERCLEVGKRSIEEKRREECFRKAADINPWKSDAYQAILQEYRNFGFSEKKYEKLVSFLEEEVEGGMTREYCLKQSSDYGNFAYQMGLACFFEWGGYGNKKYAYPWLTEAIETSNLTKQEKVIAETLQKISSYYQEIWEKETYGTGVISYAKLWKDLRTLYETTDESIKLLVQREIVNQIFSHGIAFIEAGILRDELKTILDEIQKENEGKDQKLEEIIKESIGMLEMIKQ